MTENSKIEWTHHTFNPWRGCTKVSEGCANCYAASFSKRNPKTLGIWGDDGTRIVAAHAQWTMPFKWNADAAKAGERYRVFCASLADVFEDWTGPLLAPNGEQVWVCPGCSAIRTAPLDQAPTCGACRLTSHPYTLTELRRRFFQMVDATPHLDWLLVTKRPENIRRFWIDPPNFDREEFPQRHLKNVWLLTSVENQEQAEQRIPELLKCRDLSPVLGLSCEPLLGPVDLLIDGECSDWHCPNCNSRNVHADIPSTEGNFWKCDSCGHEELGDPDWKPLIDWVIVGGESGHDARPMHPDWARSLRDQCQEAGVPFFFKQWGEYCDEESLQEIPGPLYEEATIPWSPHDLCPVYRVGKKRAGRVLDGMTWDQFPSAKESP